MKVKLPLFFFAFFFCVQVFAQEKATPRNGEGVMSFLNRWGYTIKDIPEFEQLNKGKFGKDKSLLLGVTYRLPKKKDWKATTEQYKKIGTICTQPLLGKQYEKYTIKSTVLEGACFFLSSGHGGPDCGAITTIDGRELHEDEYAYDVMLRLTRCLLEYGATVHVIIQDRQDGIRDESYLNNNQGETCMGEVIPLKQTPRLKQRSDKINTLSKASKASYQRALFIHLDSQGQKKQLDVYFYHQHGKASTQLANHLRTAIRTQYKEHQPARGFSGTVSYRNLYVLEHTVPVAVLAELANMQNVFDRSRYLDADNRQALANWLLLGLVNDYQDAKKK